MLSKADRAVSAARRELLPGESSNNQNPPAEAQPKSGPSGRGNRGIDPKRYIDYVPCYGNRLELRSDRDGKVGTRLLEFASNWESITGDRWVIDTVTHGR